MCECILCAFNCNNKVNVLQLNKELEFIYNNPDLHDQDRWGYKSECGTVACLAGWTVLHSDSDRYTYHVGGYDEVDSNSLNVVIDNESGDRISVKQAARDILELTFDQADALFLKCSNIKELYYTANHITQGAIEIPLDLQD